MSNVQHHPVITAVTDIASPPAEVWRELTDFTAYAQWHPALHYEAPRRLVWEGGIPEVLMGQHSFVLEPYDGGTRFTESEEFTGAAAVETVETARSQMEEGYASYGRALKKRLESGH
ncbi:SRPBCC domain-containing protein [Streptomyces sp. NBC_01483]|uniref:SRPBCC domain-containing protein n=1 Tax=Streptomyces sp. NBC_01483 TaxID=2903883 RepID=UPI002E362FAC|nr:SRPBCC domain-containing protein [Streptomyces sp. NBC_01483]